MQIIKDMSALSAALERLGSARRRLALVPTMGALHDGHLALVADARTRAEAVAATIFVNPMQFNDPDDLKRYPRDEQADLAKLEAAGCDLVWLPTIAQLYPPGFATRVSVGGVSERWEGAHRPGHFDGVATVVAKLFTAIRPEVAIFGDKDFQQLAVIRRMASDLDFGIEIVAHPTVRDPDGLALSSRNARLSADERARAVALPDSLRGAARAIAAGAAVNGALEGARESLVAAGFDPIDYLALVDGESLAPIDALRAGARLIAAASLGGTRLIDNMRVIPDTV